MTEHHHQSALIKWFDIQHKKYSGRLFAIPNAAKRSAALARYMQAEGMRSGVPDLFLPVPSEKYHGLFIEMKSEKGKVSDNQKDWLNFLSGQGYMACVCYGFDDAKKVIDVYLSGK
jgi:hypothetical protein